MQSLFAGFVLRGVWSHPCRWPMPSPEISSWLGSRSACEVCIADLNLSCAQPACRSAQEAQSGGPAVDFAGCTPEAPPVPASDKAIPAAKRYAGKVCGPVLPVAFKSLVKLCHVEAVSKRLAKLEPYLRCAPPSVLMTEGVHVGISLQIDYWRW